MDAEERLSRALADRYRIERPIGRGGMATVYLAHDLKLDRPVALKVLRPEIASSLGPDRFSREIRIAAKLSHPNILALFDCGEADGLLYYTMPFLEGESLRDRLNREKQLPLEDALAIAREVAEALSHAHRHGLVHRDIKPENILFRGGHAVVADFGIARALSEAGGGTLTETGLAVGTPAYMSPEQAAGERDVDGRADLYSLGCVLYEMLSGDAPYLASTPQVMLAKKLSEPVPRISVVREAVPAGLEAALAKALARVPADRYRTAEEFGTALERAASGAPAQAKTRWGRTRAVVYAGTVVLGLATVGVIASHWGLGGPELADDLVVVLPFTNETGDASHDLVGKMLAHAITDRLDRAGTARVVPASAVLFSWEAAVEGRSRDPAHDPRAAVATEFGAGIVVSGSIFPHRDSLRLEAEITGAGGARRVQSVVPAVVASDDAAVMEGIGMVSERVAAAVAFHMDPMAGSWASIVAAAPSLAVYEAYINSLEAFFRDLQESRRELERALELDPAYLPAKTGLAVVHLNLGNNLTADSLLLEAGRSLERMAPLERGQWEWARATLDGDRYGAYRSAKEGVGRGPLGDWGHWTFGFESLRMNYPRESLDVLSRLDPDSPAMRITPGYWDDFGAALHMLGNHRRELREVRRGRARHPDNGRVLIAEIRARAALGHVREVGELVEEAIRKEAQPVQAFTMASRELRAHGHQEASRAMAERGLAYLEEQPAQARNTAEYRYSLARTLYLLERWEDAQLIFEELIPLQPSNANYLGYLGTLSARRGQAVEAARISAQLASMEIPYDRGNSTYWRACIASLLGEKEEAVSLLRQAHQEGWQFSPSLHTDPDLEPLRDYPSFQEFLRPKG